MDDLAVQENFFVPVLADRGRARGASAVRKDLAYCARKENSREAYNEESENVRVCINDKLIDKILAKAITGSTKKIIIVLCITAALFSSLRVQKNTGKNAVPVIQHQNRKAAKEEQKSRLQQIHRAFFYTIRYLGFHGV